MILDADFPTHWKTELLCDLLSDRNAGMHLVRLWCHCQARMEDSFALTPVQLASICKYPVTQAEKLDAALQECRFIERGGSRKLTVTVLGWRDRNRKLFADKANGSKGGRPAKKAAPDNPSTTHDQPNGNPTETHGLPVANPSGTHGEPSRVEKSRVE